MDTKTYLYDAFGELIYLIANADGIIQEAELEALQAKLENHPWAQEIQWSFNYEAQKNKDPEDLYKKVLMACQDHGPDPEYQFMIEVMETVAEASNGIDEKENATMKRFVQELTERFKRDVENIR